MTKDIPEVKVDIEDLSEEERRSFDALRRMYNYGVILKSSEMDFKNEAVRNMFLNSHAVIPHYLNHPHFDSYNQVWR